MDKIKVREVKYDKIDEVLEKFIESGEFEEDLVDFEIKDGEAFGEDLVILSSPAWRVTDKGLIFVEGTYFSLQNRQYNTFKCPSSLASPFFLGISIPFLPQCVQ